MPKAPPRRRLVVVRHAKSDYPEGVEDHDRPLSDRGERDAQALGPLLRDVGWPELVLCSTAVRARRTWELAEGALDVPTTVRYEPSLYLATARAVLGMVRGVDDDVERLVLVAHNPGAHDLAVQLVGAGRTADRDRLEEKMPTSGVVVLGVGAPWADLGDGCATLLSFTAARG